MCCLMEIRWQNIDNNSRSLSALYSSINKLETMKIQKIYINKFNSESSVTFQFSVTIPWNMLQSIVQPLPFKVM